VCGTAFRSRTPPDVPRPRAPVLCASARVTRWACRCSERACRSIARALRGAARLFKRGHQAPSSLCTGVCAAARAGRVDADGRGPGRARTLHDPGGRQVVPAVALGGAATHGLCVRRHRDPQKGRLPGLFQRSPLVGPDPQNPPRPSWLADPCAPATRKAHTQPQHLTVARDADSTAQRLPLRASDHTLMAQYQGWRRRRRTMLRGHGGARHAPTGCCSPWTLAASCSATATGVKLGQGSVGVAAHPRAAARRGCWRPATLRRPAAAPRRSRPGS